MSSTTKKKYVMDEVLNNYDTPTENQQIVKVVHGKGNNLHEVCTTEGEVFLASMPPKFRKNIWIKRGDFVVVEPIVEGVKVRAEIVQILMKDQIRYYKSLGIWPKKFDEKNDSDKGDCDNDDEDDLFVNHNRRACEELSSSDEESSKNEET